MTAAVPVAEPLPQNLVEEEALVVRQAHAVVIAGEDDYRDAGEFLNKVIVPLRKQVESHFDPKVARWYAGWQAEIADRKTHLDPLEKAEKIVKACRAKFIQERDERLERERLERERAAMAVEVERRRQEAEAERERAAAEAERVRQEAERRQIAAEAEAERLRNTAAEEEDLEAERRAAELEHQAAEERAAAEARAAEIATAGEQTALAIAAEPIHLDLPDESAERLTGTSKTWKCNRADWDPVKFALWIAGDPPDGSAAHIAATARAKYIKEPDWSLLDAEAKAQKSRFSVGGIKAGQKYSGRAGK